jgi:hypothetical protein
MVSNTRQTKNRRRARDARLARRQKARRHRAGTPKFPIHLDGDAAKQAAPTKAKATATGPAPAPVGAAKVAGPPGSVPAAKAPPVAASTPTKA